MVHSIVGQIFDGSVVRVEHFGIFLDFQFGNAIVLIPDLSSKPLRDPSSVYSINDLVRFKIVSYLSDVNLYKGSVLEARSSRE
jgi:ribosomal protein S1